MEIKLIKQLFSHFYFFAIIQSLILIVVLTKAQRNRQTIYLCILIAFLSGTLLNYYFIFEGIEFYVPGLSEVSWFSIGPMFYLLTKSIVDSSYEFKWLELSYFSIPIYNLIQTILYLIGINFFLIDLMDTVIYNVLFIYLYIFSALLFNQFSIRKIETYIINSKFVLSSIDQKVFFLKKFFQAFQLFLVMFLVAQTYALYNLTYYSIIEYYLLMLFSLFIISIAYKAMARPQFLYFKHVKKYKNSKIDNLDFTLFERKLDKLMKEEKPYLKSDLKLSDLSKSIEIKTNTLSQLFSQKMKLSFYDYINNYRVDEFVTRINQGYNKQFTIESIAFDCGFKHKTVFYKYFKQRFHKTPKQYLGKE